MDVEFWRASIWMAIMFLLGIVYGYCFRDARGGSQKDAAR